MAYIGRFLRPIRASFCALSSPNSSFFCTRNLSNGNYGHSKTWVKKSLESVYQVRASKLYSMLNVQKRDMWSLIFSGYKNSVRNVFSISFVTGLISLGRKEACAINDLEDDPYEFFTFTRKFWLPVMLVITAVMDWNRPLSLALKVILYLLSTKPNALSIYIFVEQLQRQSMCEDPFSYRIQPNYANTVSMKDYMVFFLAHVEHKKRRITVVGILGSWWVWNSTSCGEDTSFLLDTECQKNR